MDSVSDEILERFRAVPTSTICDANVKAGIRIPERILIEGVHPVLPRSVRAVGRARTQRKVLVRDRARLAQAINPQFSSEFVEGARPGDVLVIAAPPGPHAAIFGGMLAVQARRSQVAGVIVDGATRDAAEILSLGLPVWARSFTPVAAGYAGYSTVEVNGPVTCGGVEVMPGDLIVADGDGVVVVPADDAERLLPICEEMQRAEEACTRALDSGASIRDAYPSRSYYWNKPASG